MTHDFQLTDDSGETFRYNAAHRRAHPGTMLVFLPDLSSRSARAWVKELVSAHEQFEEVAVDISLITTDSEQVLARFRKALGIKFRLLSDPTGRAAALYGVSAGYPQPAIFGFEKEKRLYESSTAPSMIDRLRGKSLPDPELVCLAMAKHLDKEPAFRIV